VRTKFLGAVPTTPMYNNCENSFNLPKMCKLPKIGFIRLATEGLSLSLSQGESAVNVIKHFTSKACRLMIS
jgi:hypothetical protein